jgi:hypothetical protein
MRIISPHGDYSDRLAAIKAAGARFHIQYHADDWGRTGSRALCEVNVCADPTTRIVAAELAQRFGAIFNQGVSDVRTLHVGDRGHGCLGEQTPGIIIEPVNLADPRMAAEIRKPVVQKLMGADIASVLRAHYTDKVLGALTIGHKFKTSSPNDEGANLYPDGTPNDGDDTEADVMERVLFYTVQELTKGAVMPHTSDVLKLEMAMMREDTWQASGIDGILHGAGLSHAAPTMHLTASAIAALPKAAKDKMMGDVANVANAWLRDHWRDYADVK